MKNFKNFLMVIFVSLNVITTTFAQDKAQIITIDQDFNRELSTIKLKFQNPIESIDENLKSFNKLISLFDRFHQHHSTLGKKLLKSVNDGRPLTGDDLYSLKRTMTTYFKFHQKVLDFTKAYDFGNQSFGKTFAQGEKEIPYIKSRLLYTKGQLSMLTHLVESHKVYYEESGLFRRIVKNALKDKENLNDGPSKTLNDLLKLSEYTISVGESKKFSAQVHLVFMTQNELKEMFKEDVSTLSTIDGILLDKSALSIVHGDANFKLHHYVLNDTFAEGFSKITNWLSKIFGNIAGSIRWREGFLYKNNTALNLVKEKLIPMDIILEKSPFVLTDQLIPGHYGHVAIYLGTKEQLEKLDMWNHPDIVRYHDEIEQGKVILEAVRPGVRISTLEEFMNIDEITIMRKNDALTNPEVLVEQFTRGFDQIGKEYDFNFDVETLDKIVCSELIYVTFGQVFWPTKYRLGRSTISPDDVAEVLFQKNTKFEIIDYFISKTPHRIEQGNVLEMASELSFELRSEDGTEIKNPNDQTNSFWKKEEKCFTVSTENKDQTGSNFSTERACRTVYKQYFYEEKELSI